MGPITFPTLLTPVPITFTIAITHYIYLQHSLFDLVVGRPPTFPPHTPLLPFTDYYDSIYHHCYFITFWTEDHCYRTLHTQFIYCNSRYTIPHYIVVRFLGRIALRPVPHCRNCYLLIVVVTPHSIFILLLIGLDCIVVDLIVVTFCYVVTDITLPTFYPTG